MINNLTFDHRVEGFMERSLIDVHGKARLDSLEMNHRVSGLVLRFQLLKYRFPSVHGTIAVGERLHFRTVRRLCSWTDKGLRPIAFREDIAGVGTAR